MSQYLISVASQRPSHIWHLLLGNLDQERTDLLKEGVAHVVIPGGDKYAVLGLQDEVVRDVIYNDGLRNVTAKQGEILH